MVLWGLAVTISRAASFFLTDQTMADTYEYYENAMIQAQERQQVFSTGLAFIYRENLSGLLQFTGNRIEAAGVYQMILQILWLWLFFAGVCMIFGRLAGFTAGTLMAVSPWILGSIFVVAPENFYMLFWAAALLFLGLAVKDAKDAEKEKNDAGAVLCFLAAGFLAGMITVWHYLGLYLFLVIGYVWVVFWSRVKKKFVLFIGMMLGGGVSCAHIAAAAGKSAAAQFDGWMMELQKLPRRFLYEETELENWLFCAIGAAVLCRNLAALTGKGKSREQEEAVLISANTMQETERKVPQKTETEDEKPESYFIAQDGRKVKYLDNPLPVPKKHVKKEMNFAIDDVEGDFDINDDFDLQISSGDDFDI